MVGRLSFRTCEILLRLKVEFYKDIHWFLKNIVILLEFSFPGRKSGPESYMHVGGNKKESGQECSSFQSIQG